LEGMLAPTEGKMVVVVKVEVVVAERDATPVA
jgi:hypothetical protein